MGRTLLPAPAIDNPITTRTLSGNLLTPRAKGRHARPPNYPRRQLAALGLIACFSEGRFRVVGMLGRAMRRVCTAKFLCSCMLRLMGQGHEPERCNERELQDCATPSQPD